MPGLAFPVRRSLPLVAENHRDSWLGLGVARTLNGGEVAEPVFEAPGTLPGLAQFRESGRGQMKVRRILFLSLGLGRVYRSQDRKHAKESTDKLFEPGGRECVGGTSWRSQVWWSWPEPLVRIRAI